MNARMTESAPQWQPLTVAESLGLRLLPRGWHGRTQLTDAAERELQARQARADVLRLQSATLDEREEWLARLAGELDNEHTKRAQALCSALDSAETRLRAWYEAQLADVLRELLAVPVAHLTLLQNLAHQAASHLPQRAFVLEVPASWSSLATATVAAAGHQLVATTSESEPATRGVSDCDGTWSVVPRPDRTSPVVLIRDGGTGTVRCAIDGELGRVVEQLVHLRRLPTTIAEEP